MQPRTPVSRIAASAIAALLSMTAAAATAPVPGSAPDPEQVTIEARRLSQQRELTEFVDHVPLQVEQSGYARWRSPICPLVAGLTAQGGEFLVTRLSQIARAVGAPLAGPDCRDFNLYIIVTSDPATTLRKFAARDHNASFGDASLPHIRQFIDTPQPVRVWYNTADGGADGANLSSALNNAGLPTHDSIGLRTNTFASASRLALNVMWGFRSVFVTIDARDLRGVSNGQLADYVALVSLAQMNLNGVRATAPSLLRLFDSAPQAAPPALTRWDSAFLAALYASDSGSTQQREHILHTMQSQLAKQPRDAVPALDSN